MSAALSTLDYRFSLHVSDDNVKSDLELVCDECGEHICDAEAGDTLMTLASVAADHVASCPGEQEDDYNDDDGLTDVEADAMTLTSAGWGTDEDYSYTGEDD